jgi:two-component system sensor histidine kinase/response regulator
MGQKRSIVIVDDDVDVSQMTRMRLEQTGLYTVRVCNRGSEALAFIRKTRPDMVLLDIVMPDADGTEIAQQIKEDKSLAGIRVVFMTSLVEEGELDRSSVIGGYPFISKPITGEALLKSVKEFFELGH